MTFNYYIINHLIIISRSSLSCLCSGPLTIHSARRYFWFAENFSISKLKKEIFPLPILVCSKNTHKSLFVWGDENWKKFFFSFLWREVREIGRSKDNFGPKNIFLPKLFKMLRKWLSSYLRGLSFEFTTPRVLHWSKICHPSLPKMLKNIFSGNF